MKAADLCKILEENDLLEAEIVDGIDLALNIFIDEDKRRSLLYTVDNDGICVTYFDLGDKDDNSPVINISTEEAKRLRMEEAKRLRMEEAKRLRMEEEKGLRIENC
ncbi:hypothetical protein [Butyrivibrio fibrisolvens]|uniref:hypothetical protein n=1 Tax=Butyrivibrio fibrisolvens TaxID=831 RepID=UPI0003B53DA7|nr:hypothetical protein [Butyrivibrio fibrisolvens]